MASQEFVNDETGETGRFHLIRGEQRFIPNDPEAVPGASVNLQFDLPGERFDIDTGLQLAGGAAGAALIGFGETIANTQLRGEAAIDTLSGREGTEAQQEFAEVKSLLAPLEAEHPFATAVGQSVPGFLLPSSKAVQTLGGIAEGITADPENPILGGVLGGAGGFLGGVIGQKLAAKVAARVGGPAGRLAARNIPTTLAQRNPANATEQSIEAGLQAIPVINRWAAAPARAQQRALNRGAAQVFGFEGKLTPAGLGTIRKGISKSFRQVEAGIPDQVLDPALIKRLDNLDALDDATLDLLTSTSGVIDGEGMMAIRSSLNNDMADAFINANRKEGRRLQSALTEIDDLITAQMPEALVAQWATARKQWQFLTAITRGKAISGTGDVNLASMRNALQKIYPNFRVGAELPGSAQGFGELIQALDELPKALQSSGTAERAVAAAALTGGSLVAPGTTAGGAGLATLAAARAVGQPGIDVGSLAGRAIARRIERPIDEALADIDSEPEPAQ